jgi:hypothetical protein
MTVLVSQGKFSAVPTGEPRLLGIHDQILQASRAAPHRFIEPKTKSNVNNKKL